MTPIPTQGRVVLVNLVSHRGEIITRPALIIIAHNVTSITVAALLAPHDRIDSAPVQTMEAVLYDPTGKNDRGWRWLDFQLGQVAKTDELAALNRTAITELNGTVRGLDSKFGEINGTVRDLLGRLQRLENASAVTFPAAIAADGIKVTPQGLELAGAVEARGVQVDMVGGPDSSPNAPQGGEPMTADDAERKATPSPGSIPQSDRDILDGG